MIVASPSERQSQEFLGKCEEFAEKLQIKARGDGRNCDLAGVSEAEPDCGIAGKGGRGAGVFGVAGVDRRGVAGDG